MPVGSTGVVDYANTTSGEVSGVVALGGLGGDGVVEQGGTPSPTYIITLSGDLLTTLSGDYLTID